MSDAPIDLKGVQVTIHPAAPEIEDGIHHVATIECPAMDLPESFLLFAPELNDVQLVAPCGCRTGVRLTSLLVSLRDTVRKAGHSHPGRPALKKPDASQAAAIGFRKAVPPEPKRYPQCRNCKHIVYDDEFYMPLGGGGERSRRTNLRCRQHAIAVLLSCVCDAHEFAYRDRSDR